MKSNKKIIGLYDQQMEITFCVDIEHLKKKYTIKELKAVCKSNHINVEARNTQESLISKIKQKQLDGFIITMFSLISKHNS